MRDQVVEIEDLRKVVTDRLGCAPNFKYHYQPDQDMYIGAPHQYNCTYFSALSGNAKQYLLCRAIQFFTPGIPMVYYVGLFAGRNDWAVIHTFCPPCLSICVVSADPIQLKCQG